MKTSSDLYNCLGTLKKDEEWKKIEKVVRISWKKWERKLCNNGEL